MTSFIRRKVWTVNNNPETLNYIFRGQVSPLLLPADTHDEKYEISYAKDTSLQWRNRNNLRALTLLKRVEFNI